MIKFDTLAPIEKAYPFENAEAAADYKNGTFGSVTSGKFTAGATGFYGIMEIERGDDSHYEDFRIKKGADCRVVNFAKADGYVIKITSEHLPSVLKVADKMVSKADGTLNVPSAAPTEKYFEVTEITSYGCKAKIVKL